MICYKNGALAREHIRNLYATADWDTFSNYLKETPPGNNGNIGFYFEEQEIVPHLKGFYYFDEKDNPATSFQDGKVHIRAIVESQALSMLVHSQNIGLKVTHGVLVTGGASKNEGLLQVLSDVFGVPVYTGQQPNSASLGAAYKAIHGTKCNEAGKFVPFVDVVGGTSFQKSALPNMDNHQLYLKMSVRYKHLEEKLLNETLSAHL